MVGPLHGSGTVAGLVQVAGSLLFVGTHHLEDEVVQTDFFRPY